MTSDDECVVAIDLLQETHILGVIGSSELLHIIKNHLAATQVTHCGVAFYHLAVDVVVEGNMETGHLPTVRERHSHLVILVISIQFREYKWDIPDFKLIASAQSSFHNLCFIAAERRVFPQIQYRCLRSLINIQVIYIWRAL